MANPFISAITTDPWDSIEENSVSEINKNAFDLCCTSLKTIPNQKRTVSLLFHGEPGSGKTHLLNRLRVYAYSQQNLHIFISVRLQSSPHRFWRYLRKSFIESLMHKKKQYTQLEKLIFHKLKIISGKKTIKIKELDYIIEQLGVQCSLSFNLCSIIKHIVLKKHQKETLSWLKGLSLPELSIKKLGLSEKKNSCKNYEEEDIAREFILEICRLAGHKIPVILCFDQVEALQRYQKGDPESLFAFGQAVGAIHDQTNNVLIVSCIQSFFIDLLKNSVMESDYDRMAVYQSTLNPLTKEQALKLVYMRLKACPDITKSRIDFLLLKYKKELNFFISDHGEVARKIISKCASLFNIWEKGKLPETERFSTLDAFLTKELLVRETLTKKNLEPSKANDIIQSSIPSILNIIDNDWKESEKELPNGIDMILYNKNSKTGISFCNHENMKKLVVKLKHIDTLINNKQLDKIILVRHKDLQINKTAKKTQLYFEKLQKENTVITENPDNTVLSALESLRSLLSDAKSGDLSKSGVSVEFNSVKNWIESKLSDSVKDLLIKITDKEIVLKNHGKFDPLSDILEIIDKEKIIEVAKIAEILSLSTEEILKSVKKSEFKIGLLSNSPPVLFQFINLETNIMDN